jgi:hypothetical protein
MSHIHLCRHLPLPRALRIPPRPSSDEQGREDEDEEEEQGGHRAGLSILVRMLTS